MYLKIYNLLKNLLLISVVLIITPINAEEEKNLEKNTEYNFYSGTFDFSDAGKKTTLIGFQHQNEELNRDTFIGNLSPVTGAQLMANNATYLYTGVQAQYELGKINFNPSFTPGLYGAGDGKDLGHVVEFKTELQLTVDMFENSEFGIKYNHLSNGSIGDKNPGANSYMLNFLKRF